MDLYHSFIEVTGILYTKIFTGRFFFFDLWSVNHMWTGFMLFLILSAFRFKKPLAVIAICLFGYEIFEILLTYFATNIFIPEIIKDQFTDIFIGLTGSIAGFLFISNYDNLIVRFPSAIRNVFIFFISMSFAFLWLVFSHESVSLTGTSSVEINLIIFFMWLAQAFITILMFRKHGSIKNARPWAVFMFTFILATLLNFCLISLPGIADLNTNALIHWLSLIKIKLILIPLLPFLLLAAHKVFIRLIVKAREGFSHSKIKNISRVKPEILTYKS
jgi:hypothetical protein